MGRRRKPYDRIVDETSDANIPFEQTEHLLIYLGFERRVSGSHRVFVRQGIEEIINLQEVRGKCKPYQVKQMHAILKKYNLGKEL